MELLKPNKEIVLTGSASVEAEDIIKPPQDAKYDGQTLDTLKNISTSLKIISGQIDDCIERLRE